MKTILIFLCYFQILVCTAQSNYGNNWVFGDSVQLDFTSGSPINISNHYFGRSVEATSAISDSLGRLDLYISSTDIQNNNFLNIYDSTTNIINNGDSILCYTSCAQGALLLPGVNYTHVITLYFQTIPNTEKGIAHALIEKTNGIYTVVSKNIRTIYSIHAEQIIAIRHGNGQDWWILGSTTKGNIYKLLLANDSLYGPFLTSNAGQLCCGIGTMAASLNGDKLVSGFLNGSLLLFSFDRCTGNIISTDTLSYKLYTGSFFDGYYGTSFSPDGSKLYASTLDSLFLYDLNSSNVKQTRTLLYVIPNDSIKMAGHKLGKDGKIYIVNSYYYYYINDSLITHLTVIENPDSLNCIVKPYNFSLNGRVGFYGMPNIPNYNLVALTGSVCDTLTSNQTIESNAFAKCYPNPVSEFLYFLNYNNSDKLYFTLYNLQGISELHSEITSRNFKSGINITHLPNGLYIAELRNAKGDKVVRQKLVVQH